MNERTAAVVGILAGEAGGALVLAYGFSENPMFHAVPSLGDLLGTEVAVDLLLLTLLGAFCWIVSPSLFRIRQELSSKFRVLMQIVGFYLLVLEGVCLFFYHSSASDAATLSPVTAPVLAALVGRGLTSLVLFGAACLALYWVSRNRTIQVTPSPKFGRE